MSTPMPPLRIVAQPKASYRERYMCETDRFRNRAQRFVRAENNSFQFVYPTIEIPKEWTFKVQHSLYIRLTLVTVPNQQVTIRCVHPYPIDTEDVHVIKDPSSNSLYFLVSSDELLTGQKSFQFTQKKLTKYQLRTHGPLKIFNSDEKDENRLKDPTDVRKLIETYDLRQSQLVFSIAVFQRDNQLPVIYDISSVFSHAMSAVTTTISDDDLHFRCAPKKGDCAGGDEIIMVIPKLDKRKVFHVRFDHPMIDSSDSLHVEFLDSKTIVFYSPPCPVKLTAENPSVSIPIIITQKSQEIGRADFVYQSLNKCLSCHSNTISTNSNLNVHNKRLCFHFDHTDIHGFDEIDLGQARKNTSNHSSTRNYMNSAKTSLTPEDKTDYLSFHNTTNGTNIDSNFKLTKTSNNCSYKKTDMNDVLLINSTPMNHNQQIKSVSKKRIKLDKQVEDKRDNLLRVMVSVTKDNSKVSMENFAPILDDNIEYYLSRLIDGQNSFT